MLCGRQIECDFLKQWEVSRSDPPPKWSQTGISHLLPVTVLAEINPELFLLSHFRLQSDLAYPVLFFRIPRHPEENHWLPIYSICHAYIQYVCPIIWFPRLSGYFCGKPLCAVKRGLTVASRTEYNSTLPDNVLTADVRVDSDTERVLQGRGYSFHVRHVKRRRLRLNASTQTLETESKNNS